MHHNGIHSVTIGAISHPSHGSKLSIDENDVSDWLSPPLQSIPAAGISLLCVVGGALVIAGQSAELILLQLNVGNFLIYKLHVYTSISLHEC